MEELRIRLEELR